MSLPHGFVSRLMRPRIGLRTWAILLVLAAAIPVILFSWAALTWMAQEHVTAFAKAQTDTTRLLAEAVDGELRMWKAALTALAQSSVLQQNRMAEFYQEAKAVAAQHDGWIVLTDPSGQQHLNTSRPYGTPLPKSNALEFLNAVITTGEPAVGDLIWGAVAQRWIVSVAVPVVRAGRVVYMLDMAFTPDRLTRLLERQHLPAGWAVTIHDGQYRTVTRLPLAAERSGKPAQPWFEAALRTADHGSAIGQLADGVPGRSTG
jgi:two-component system, sensor histidine kinase